MENIKHAMKGILPQVSAWETASTLKAHEFIDLNLKSPED